MDTTYIAGKKYISKQEVYLVENYSDDSTSLKAIDSFVNKNKDTTALKTYNQYSITFYKKSSETNVENIKVSKRVIDRYSNQHDLLYGYSWYQSKFLYRSKYKDGTMVEPKSNIIVADPPK